MATYKVFLVDTLNTIGDDQRRGEIKAILTTYFDPIVKQAGLTDGLAVQFITSNPQPSDIDLICYYIPNPPHIVGNIDSSLSGNSSGSGQGAGDGLTLWSGGVTGSDMIANKTISTKLLANVTFHEFMHNKLQLKDAKLHPMGGLAGASVDDTTSITADNKSKMAAALTNKRPQWIGGFGLLDAAKNKDPLSPYVDP